LRNYFENRGQMYTYEELYALITKTAQEDERIRAVTMEGSGVTPGACHDKYSDFDITFFVTDVREFSGDRGYMDRFGQVLILQRPDDWYGHPYDYEGRENYAFLTQYKDGSRIDLTVIDICNINKQTAFDEPRRVLLNKDSFPQLKDIPTNEAFFIKKPSALEYFNTCNEFRWISNYVTKGLCRHELTYVKRMMDVYMMDMFMKMMDWRIATENDFRVTTGVWGKHWKKYLSPEEMERVHSIFAGGSYEEIWEKLFVFYDYFAQLAVFVADRLEFEFDQKESDEVRAFMKNREAECRNVQLTELSNVQN